MIKRIVILRPSRPLNFSESCNVGIKNSNNDKIFIANDDIIISKNTLEKLSENVDDNIIVGPDSNCNLGFQTDYAYKVSGVPLVPAMTLDQVKHILPNIYNIDVTRKEILERDWLAFFAIMFTRKCFEEVGYMDENYIYDREDLDWDLRAKAKGKKFYQIFESYCFHFGGISRKRKHEELGLKYEEDSKHNLDYFNSKWNPPRGQTKDMVVVDENIEFHKKPLLAFYCSDAWEHWDEKSLNSSVQSDKPSGIGGSETQVILLAREFSKLGYTVKIFNKCKERHYDGDFDVEYISFQDFYEFSKNVEYDYFIASRYLDCFDVPFKSKRNFAMIHDVFLILNQGRNPHDVHQDKIEKYFCLSNRHKQFVSQHHNIPMDQIVMTSNGLDMSRFQKKKKIKRDPYRLIYSSSPDRGLELLLYLLDEVKKHVPQITLHVYYGFENFKDQEYIKKMRAEIDRRDYVTYHGRVGQDQLAEEFMKSTIWTYSSWFSETFSITALEAMAAGTVIISSYFWGLIDTVKESGILIPMNDDPNTVLSKEYQIAWINNCIEILKNNKLAEKWRKKGYERIKRFTWENVAKQWSTYFERNEWNEIQ